MRLPKHGLSVLALSAASLTWLSGCGSSGGGSSHAVPAISSAPVTTAVQGNAYNYTLAATDPGGGTVSFALTTAPDGATLSGNTITWTPTAAESRVANAFTVTATTSEGGTATQSWSVTPSGTVQVTEVNTYWGPGGATTGPISWSASYPAAAVLIPQADGTFEATYGTSDTNGVLSFQNVPGGYFWLSLGPTYNYWTSSSAIDLSHDAIGGPIATLSGLESTSFDLNFTVSSISVPALLQFVSVPPAVNITESINTAGYSSSSFTLGSNIDYSQVHYGFAMEDLSASLGLQSGYVLAAEETVTDLQLTNGTANTITATLTPSPQASLPLTINGSAWGTLFDNAAPTAPTPSGSALALQAEPFVSGVNVNSAISPGLFWTVADTSLLSSGTSTSAALAPALQSCPSGFFESISIGTDPAHTAATLTLPPPITSDTDFGTINYGDPFPAAWPRVFSFCQQAAVALPSLTTTTTVPVFGGTETETITWSYNLVNRQTIAPPSAAVVPLISPVQNPTLNGASLFTTATLNTRSLSLSWQKPTLGTSYGYAVHFASLPTTGLILRTTNLVTLFTAQTSMNVPPELLTAGQTYLIDITALVDGKADMETSPNRSGLPTAAANVVSAPITISSSAP